MAFENMSDQSLLMLYENIRQQVAEDIRLDSRHRLLGEAAKQRAERLRFELDYRRLHFNPIIWK